MSANVNENECRVYRSGNYTLMGNYHLHSTAIGLKPTGLLCHVINLPDVWDYSITQMIEASAKAADSSADDTDDKKDELQAGRLIRSQVVGILDFRIMIRSSYPQGYKIVYKGNILE